jgi:hypothetical protein
LNKAPRKRGSFLALFLLLLTSHFEELDEGPYIGHKVWHPEPGDERSAGISGKGLTAESFFRPKRGSAYVFGFPTK